MAELEQAMISRITEVLDAHAQRLTAFALTWRGPEIEVWRKTPEQYTSELRVTFFKEDDIYDIIEFYMYKNGYSATTIEKTASWFAEQHKKLVCA